MASRFLSLTIKPFPKEVYSYTLSRLTVQGGESRDVIRLFLGQKGQEIIDYFLNIQRILMQ